MVQVYKGKTYGGLPRMNTDLKARTNTGRLSFGFAQDRLSALCAPLRMTALVGKMDE
jgi:hypothetical protein